MTSAQFAIAVGADPMWVRNARRALGRPRRIDAGEARWLGMVHDLQSSLGIALGEAARIADRACGGSCSDGVIEVATGAGMSVSIAIDVARAGALHELRLAAALHLPAIDRRGRPATSYRVIVADLERRVRRGSDPIRISLSARRPAAERLAALGGMADLLAGLASAGVRFIAIGGVAGALLGTLRQPSVVDVLHDASDPASLASLAGLLRQWRARPRGAAAGASSVHLDVALISAQPDLALDTDVGALNLWTQCQVVGDYAAAQGAVLDPSRTGFPFPILDLAALRAMARDTGRGRDDDWLYELRQLEVDRQRLARLERYRRTTLSSSATTLG